MHSAHLSNFLAGFKIAQQKKKFSYKYRNVSKFILSNIRLLVKCGFIYGYTVEFEEVNRCIYKNVVIFLKYYSDGSPIVTNLKIFTRPSCIYHLQLKVLRKYIKRDSFATYVISTSEGVVREGLDCIAQHKGGILLYKLN